MKDKKEISISQRIVNKEEELLFCHFENIKNYAKDVSFNFNVFAIL